jgi:NAD(P)-dependent dehydrogenase (short-subunit alcohol dehydrogenase family)
MTMSGRPHAGRVAVITGAASGIGQALAVRLAEAGATIVAVDVGDLSGTEERVRAANAPFDAVSGDVSDPAVSAQLKTLLEGRHGRCDICVNNAAIDDPVGWDDLSLETWRRVLSVNLDAHFLICKAVTDLMKQRQWGRIVNLVSGSVLNPIGQLVAYRASKLGVVGFTRALAVELGPFGITVNAVSPGITNTPMALATLGPGTINAAAQARALKRVAEPDDVAAAITLMVADEAHFVTGQHLLANGGASFL